MADALIVEGLDAAGRQSAPGDIGRVVVSNLGNFASPLIRYDIGDYAEVGNPPKCGRGLPVLQRIVGRSRNLLIMPDGRRQWPLTGYGSFREVAPVLQFQFVQTGRTAIEVRLVVSRSVTSEEENALRSVILAALGYPFTLAFKYHQEPLRRDPSGKFEEFICAIATGAN
jgi:phenylacetate-CoA ligase